MARKESNKTKKKKGKTGALLISVIVLFFGGLMWSQIDDSKAELKELKNQKTKLEARYEEEMTEQENLEERRVYVQTKKYIEEKAKAIGYVYPDEIIYKPKE